MFVIAFIFAALFRHDVFGLTSGFEFLRFGFFFDGLFLFLMGWTFLADNFHFLTNVFHKIFGWLRTVFIVPRKTSHCET